jgi:hypothetical protein
MAEPVPAIPITMHDSARLSGMPGTSPGMTRIGRRQWIALAARIAEREAGKSRTEIKIKRHKH